MSRFDGLLAGLCGLLLTSAVPAAMLPCDDALMCNNLGISYEHGEGVSRNFEYAARYYYQACKMGLASGCENLGTLYYKGMGVAADPDRGRALWARACEAERGPACYKLGLDYKRLEDHRSALRFFEKGCRVNHAASCGNAGLFHLTGVGAGRVNLKRAYEYLRKGCDRQDGPSCNQLGMLYLKGLGGTVNRQQAAECFRIGCANGDNQACQRYEQTLRR